VLLTLILLYRFTIRFGMLNASKPPSPINAASIYIPLAFNAAAVLSHPIRYGLKKRILDAGRLDCRQPEAHAIKPYHERKVGRAHQPHAPVREHLAKRDIRFLDVVPSGYLRFGNSRSCNANPRKRRIRDPRAGSR
jgi:hypothetical protein